MNIFLTPFYMKSPVVLQQCMASMQGFAFKMLREGRLFRKLLSQLEESQYYSEEELAQLQREKLKLIIKHCYENVPYYRRLFRELRLRPEDFKDAPDLRKLPLISKETVKSNPEDFVAVNINKFFMRKIFTSGSTGSPLKVYRDMYSINFENAILRRQYRWAGFEAGDKRVILRSSPIVPSDVKDPPFWRHDVFQRNLLASVYHISEKNIPYYVRELSRFKADALDAVPSAAYLLARLMEHKDMRVDFKYIFTSSEIIPKQQKAFMEDYFNARLFDHYGSAERVSAIGMCEKGNYHIYPEYGITEFLPVEGNGGCFELVGSTLNNLAMPLLRYKTGDIVTPSYTKCACGREFPTVSHIDGRKGDSFFITKDGRFISLFSGMVSIGLKDVIETQFVQEDFDSIKVNIVTGKGYSSSDELMLRKSVRKFLGEDIRICIEKVPFIPRTKGGKFLQFISKLNREDCHEKVGC